MIDCVWIGNEIKKRKKNRMSDNFTYKMTSGMRWPTIRLTMKIFLLCVTLYLSSALLSSSLSLFLPSSNVNPTPYSLLYSIILYDFWFTHWSIALQSISPSPSTIRFDWNGSIMIGIPSHFPPYFKNNSFLLMGGTSFITRSSRYSLIVQ